MKKKKKDGIFFLIFSFCVGIAQGVFLYYNLIFHFSPQDSLFKSFLILLLECIILILSIYTQTVVHELGHLCCGLISGYSLISFRTGPFMLSKNDKGFAFSIHRIVGTGGQCLLLPPDCEDKDIPFFLYNFGGVIFNIVFSVVFLICSFSAYEYGYLYNYLIECMSVGILFAFVNGIPFTTSMIPNDGKNICFLAKSLSTRKIFLNELRINAFLSNGMRLKDLPNDLFQYSFELLKENSLASSATMSEESKLLDQKEFVKARDFQNSIINSGLPLCGLNRNLLMVDMLYTDILLNGNDANHDILLDPHFKKFLKSMRGNLSVLRTEYAVTMVLLRDPAGAQKIKRMFFKACNNYANNGKAASEKELIGLIDDII